MLYERIQKEYTKLQDQIADLQNKFQFLPPGKLICAKNKNGCKWYQSDGHTKQYIPKSNRPLAEQLALKKYYSLELDELLQESNALSLYLKHPHSDPGKAHELLTSNPAYSELLAPYFYSPTQEFEEWQNAPYQHCPAFPEKLIHKTSSGHLVRSKSEALIDTFLSIHQIPFRYECALQLGETTIYPDFTIRHPLSGTLFYWEHFGQMDKPGYRSNAISKLQLYTSHGIIPSIHLITTYETLEHPLTSEMIEKIIDYYFL